MKSIRSIVAELMNDYMSSVDVYPTNTIRHNIFST